MKITLVADVTNAGRMEFPGEVETLADLSRYMDKAAKWAKSITKLLPHTKESKVTAVRFGKE